MSVSQVGYLPIMQQPVYGTSEMQVLTIQETANAYSFDASCCCETEIDDVVLRDDVVFVSKRFGCCCCTSTDNTVVKSRQIETANVKTENSSLCSMVIGWLMFGCLGFHRFCSGRKLSGILIGWLFLLSIAMTTASFILYDGGTSCSYVGVQWTCIQFVHSGWLASGIFFSVLLVFVVLWWFVDLFRLRHWSHTTVDIKTTNGVSNTFRIQANQNEAFRADLEAHYRVH